MEDSQYMAKARQALSEVWGSPLSVEERREAAIELAGNLLNEARRVQTNFENRQLSELAGMMDDVKGQAFLTSMADQCFRSENTRRTADQMLYVLKKFGVPSFLTYDKQAKLLAFKCLGVTAGAWFVPFAKKMLRSETSHVILPGERKALTRHIDIRQKEEITLNLNRLGEAILGEEEALARLALYERDLQDPHIGYISIKISTIGSQLNLLSWEETLVPLKERFAKLLRVANAHAFAGKPKFVNLDMEEYRDLYLTVALFRQVLDEPEFLRTSAGIVLQSYIPESYLVQQELTLWAMQRVMNGGAPIKIRLVKGANLAMEQVEASLHELKQAPYTEKGEVDANFKRMMNYAFEWEHAQAVHIGIGSHNLFDISYALLLRSENKVEDFVAFEMLEGMADPIRRVLQELIGKVVLYCPAAKKEEFQYAIAYLIRRLDENTGRENFLRHAFDLIPGTQQWYSQTSQFSLSCHNAKTVPFASRRTQNRLLEPEKPELFSHFVNEADTDFTLERNRKWIDGELFKWKEREIEQVPLCIAGERSVREIKEGYDPSVPEKVLYHYTLGSEEDVKQCVSYATESKWGEVSFEERAALLAQVAQAFRKGRGQLITAMIADGGKTVPEADVEVSEAIDFLEYYGRSLIAWSRYEDLEFRAKGVVLVAPPWNFPCSIPSGCIAGALAAGNSVIFKPAPETILVGWEVAKLFWEGGISKQALQFITGDDEAVGSNLVKNPNVNTVILTGATETARLMRELRPGLDLIAETGGKNALIISALSDRELAVQDLVQSAFGHAGQKCSACSLAILEAEVYDSEKFRRQLKDAASSWKVGSAWDLSTRVNPLIREPDPKLLRGLTTLDEGEEWLLEPKQDPENPNLWSPGIKLGVKEGSFMHQTELFGPVLGVMRAKDLNHAIHLANGTPYGLTAGLHSLDEREHAIWSREIIAGNLYINRTITGAIVQRQPFGGCKASSFGPGIKAGGPNYLMELMVAAQKTLPKEMHAPSQEVNILTRVLERSGLTTEQLETWRASIASYAFYFENEFSENHDPSKVLGQDNLFRYVPRENLLFRIQEGDELIDVMRVIAAAKTCGAPLEVSGDREIETLGVICETEDQMIERYYGQTIRLLQPPSDRLVEKAEHMIISPVFANGRLELLHYLREISLSVNYHRYGNLGERKPCNS